MSDSLWKKINYFFGLLTLGSLFGLVVFLTNVEIKDLDIWLHIGTGRYIFHTFSVPAVDILSHTIAGQPWVNHEWLFQVLMYTLYSLWGADGLITMQVMLVGVTMLILLMIGYERERQLLVAFTLLLVLMVYQLRFTFRPDLFSLLFFALYIFCMSMFIDRKSSVYMLFFIQVLWTNMHGFFFFGPLFVLIGLATEWTKRHIKLPYEWNEVGRLNDDEYKRLKHILVFVCLACFINPLTFYGAWYPIKVFFQLSSEHKIFFQHITELQKPIAWNLNDILSLGGEVGYFKLLIFISAMTFVYNRRNIDIGVLFFWFVFLIFSLMAIRNVPYFAFAAYLVIITNAMSLSFDDVFPIRFQEKKFKHITIIIIHILLISWIVRFGLSVSLRGYFDFDKYERKSEREGVSLRTVPHRAIDFLMKNKIKGNIFNDFNSGAYIVGMLHPDIKVFIDGRTEVYGPQFFKNYQKVYEGGDKEMITKAIEEYDMTIALFNTIRRSIPTKTVKYFYQHEEWIPVYFDYDGLVFLKDIPRHKAIIKEHKVDLKKWKAQPMDLLRLGARRIEPLPNINRAYILKNLDLFDPALEEAHAALKVDPSYSELYTLIGEIHGKRENFKDAFENYRIASILRPNHRGIRYNLAKSYFDLNEYSNAIYHYKKLIKHNPKDEKAHFLISKSYVHNNEYDLSINAVKVAQKLKPNAIGDVIGIADILTEREQYKEAIEVYMLALNVDSEQVKVHKKIGDLFLKLDKPEEARTSFERALEIDPDNKDIQKSLKGVKSLIQSK